MSPTCQAPHQPIDYAGTGPWSLDVGHIVGRDEARALGWTRTQINAIQNTHPEHARCNRAAGATYGNAKRAHNVPVPVEADEW